MRIVDTAVPNLTHIKEFSVILKALAVDGQWRRALRLLREMREIGLVPNEITYNEVLAATAKDKQVERALGLLVEMREKCVSADLTSYNHCIGACKPSEWARAVQILEEIMPEAGFDPDGQSFEYAAAACEEGGEWQRSLVLFLEIGRRGLSSTSVGHNYALSACRQGRQWRHGLEIMAEMAQRNFEPDFRLRQDIEAQSRGLERAPPPEPSRRATPSPDNLWQRKQQLRELREQDKRRQEEKRLEQERERKDRERQEQQERKRQPPEVRTKPPAQQPDAARPQPSSARPPASPEAVSSAPVERREEAKVAATKPAAESVEQAKPSQSRFTEERPAQARFTEERPRQERREERRDERRDAPRKAKHDPNKPKLRSPGSYVLPVFAQHDRSNHAERQALIKVIARVQEACGAKTDEEFEAECAEVTGTVRLYASHTPCISCMACFCQFQRLFPKVKLCVDFDDWRDTRRMVEIARREEGYKKIGSSPPNYDCDGLSDMSDEEEPESDDEAPAAGTQDAALAAHAA